MAGEPVVIQLSWQDPVTGKAQLASRQLPMAIGREVDKMPTQLAHLPVSHLELEHQQVSRCHALVSIVNQKLHIADQSANGTFVNGRLVQPSGQVLTAKDTIRIGPYKLTATVVNSNEANSTELNIGDHSAMAQGDLGTESNVILGWLLGGGVLLLLGVGLWFAAEALINQARPKIPRPNESSLLLIPGMISSVHTDGTSSAHHP